MAYRQTNYVRTLFSSDALENLIALQEALGASATKAANKLVQADADGYIDPAFVASGTPSVGHVPTYQSDGTLAYAAQTGGGGGGAAGFYSSGPNTMAQNASLDLAIGAASAPIVNAWVMEQQTAQVDVQEVVTYSSAYSAEFTELSASNTEFHNTHLRLAETRTNSPIILLHFNNESGTTTFNDACGRTVTRNGTPTLGTSPAGYYGNACGYFPAGSSYLAIASHTDFAFGTSSLTIQFRIYMSSSQSKRKYLLRHGNDSAVKIAVTVGHSNPADWDSAGSHIGIHLNNTGGGWSVQMASSAALADSTWHHVALTRSGSTWTLYIDGGSNGTISDGFSVTQDALNIGGQSYPSDTRSLSGYLDQVAINTSLIYSGNFTPPTDQLNYVSYPSGAYYAVKPADGYYLQLSQVGVVDSLAFQQDELTLTGLKWLYTTDGGITWKNHGGSTVDPADIGTSGSTAAQMTTLFTNWTPPEGGTELGLMVGLYAENFTLTPQVRTATFTYDGPVSWVRKDHGDGYTVAVYTGSSASVRFTRTATGSKTVYLVAQNGN